MRDHYQIIARSDLSGDQLARLANYRYEVFIERLEWQLPCDHLLRQELDQFDYLQGVYYVLRHDCAGRLNGCARLMPAAGDNLSRVLFPSLFSRLELPATTDAWELSRVAVDRSERTASPPKHASGADLIDIILQFANARSVNALYGVTYAAIQQLWSRQGFDIEPAGEIGLCDRKRILGCRMNVANSLFARHARLSEKRSMSQGAYTSDLASG